MVGIYITHACRRDSHASHLRQALHFDRVVSGPSCQVKCQGVYPRLETHSLWHSNWLHGDFQATPGPCACTASYWNGLCKVGVDDATGHANQRDEPTIGFGFREGSWSSSVSPRSRFVEVLDVSVVPVFTLTPCTRGEYINADSKTARQGLLHLPIKHVPGPGRA